MSDPKAEAQAHVEGEFPEWCVERAKELADAYGADYWWPFLDTVGRENRYLYGDPFPEEDPRKAIEQMRKEERRAKAAANQRVLDADRFADE